MGLIVAAAYVAGTADAREQNVRMADMAQAAGGGYSEVALRDRVLDMDPAALALARRYDPMLTTGGAQRDRQTALEVARMDRASPAPATARFVKGDKPAGGVVLRASFGGPFNPAAEPFRLAGALDASRDLDCLTQAVYYEARGETPAGQAAVAQVVLNRVRHPAFPKSVCSVVFQRAFGVCQFSFACDGSMRRGREAGAWGRARKVASRAIAGYVMPSVGNATHFHTINVSPGWGPRMVRVQQVGLHIFYRFGGGRGAPGAFDGRPRLSSPEADFQVAAASELPAGPQPYEVVTPSGAKVILASAVSDAPATGIGGPAEKPKEPASAPKAEAAAPTANAL
jgi:spore germination cell wall hydrolase CwlJ-like protein